ncbi:MAG TPA: PPOX class F420-dependent oxidoreductase [Gaiellaceae bacterium]|nr:PPOX class F420-dependent oxidoreductase [Gaiellaceae bacterium]
MATDTVQLTEPQRAFIREHPFPAVVTTLRPDGSPHSTVVWIDEDGGDVVFNTAEGRAKPRHLSRDPRVSVTVVDPDDQYRWVSVGGRAEMTTEGAREHIDKLARTYLGQDVYPWHQPGEQRIIVRVKPDKVDSYGF